MNNSQNKRVKYEHSYKPKTAHNTRGWNMNTRTNHKQLKKQEAEIWTLLQTMNSFQNKRQKYKHCYKPWTLAKQEGEIWTLLQTINSSKIKRVKYEHSYKPWTALKTRGRNMNTPTNHEQLSKQGWNMNTPTNHEQLSKQEGEIWTLLQTMNSSQNKWQKYEHSYKPRTAQKTRDRNMNTPTNNEQLSK